MTDNNEMPDEIWANSKNWWDRPTGSMPTTKYTRIPTAPSSGDRKTALDDYVSSRTYQTLSIKTDATIRAALEQPQPVDAAFVEGLKKTQCECVSIENMTGYNQAIDDLHARGMITKGDST